MSRKHKVQTVELLNEGLVQASECEAVVDSSACDSTCRPIVSEDYLETEEDQGEVSLNETFSEEENSALFVRALAITVRIILILIQLETYSS